MILAPIVFSKAAAVFNVFDANQNPSRLHLLGTDGLGRDLLLRLAVAARLSIGLALIATAISAVIGSLLGGGTALLPPPIRAVGLRFIDTMLAFPALLLAIFVGAIIGAGAAGATLGVGLAGSFYIARVASALALSVAAREYVVAARVLGVKGLAQLTRYILPNIADTLVIVVTVAVSNAIVFLAALSFLGLGVQSPQYDWGAMLTEGVQQFYVTPVAAIAPAVVISVCALAFGLSGEALARSLNPLLWTGSDSARRPGAPVVNASREAPATDKRMDSKSKDVALRVSNLSVRIPTGGASLDIVMDISFSVAKGEMLGIVGESGSGKTTVANAIVQLVPYPAVVAGTVELNGQDLSKLTKRDLDRLLGTSVAVIFQDPMSSLNPTLRVGVQLTESAEVHRHIDRGEAERVAAGHLREVNIAAAEQQMERYPHEFSGGMRQRVMIAMGLMNEPDLLIADEPTTALDVTIQAQIMEVLRQINRDHDTAIVLISHNLSLVSQNCDRLLVMYAGRIVEELAITDLANALHPYTRALLAVVPDVSRPPDQPLDFIPGHAPHLAARPAGCAFHPRCPLAEDRCRIEVPPLLTREAGGRVACWVANKDLSGKSS